MIEIEFIADFATKKKGDRWKCDGQLAAQLVGGDKVAKLVGPEKVESIKKAKKK